MMTAKRTRVVEGDILEVKIGDRLAYLQYVGKHPHYGEAIMVSPTLHDRRPAITKELLARSYTTFYPVTAAISHQLVEVIGRVAPTPLPRRLRRPGAISGRQIKTWIIEGETGEKVVSKLTEEELRLPIATIWNHAYLVQRLQEGWDPIQETIDHDQ